MRPAQRAAGSIQDIGARYGDVSARVDALLAAVRRSCQKEADESYDRANERHVEEFITWLAGAFPGRVQVVPRGAGGSSGADLAVWEAARRAPQPAVVVERQRLSAWAVRTTRWNYMFTVPGERPERVVLVAHYDTWRGPGADDNTTGEEILKQYLLADLAAPTRPALTRTYFLAGSEECGLVGVTSQVLLALGLAAANVSFSSGDWLYGLVALALCPLASYRFGVSGSREYVRTLSEPELRGIKAVLSVDSVGEGRLYIPRSTLGADFVRAMIPFGDYDSLNDLLEEGAHLHGIKYNSYLAGGTTDHVSFLEVNNGLWPRSREAVQRAWRHLRGRPHAPLWRVPAAALVAMLPGKASPLVFGGKIHTRHDLPDRIYPGPLGEALRITDYLLYRLDGGERLREPRGLDEYHYARLYRSADGSAYVALKDAIEPNQRNLNGVYRASVTLEGARAVAELGEIVGWGVEVRLGQEARETAADIGESWEQVPLEELEVRSQGTRLWFERRPRLGLQLERLRHEIQARAERAMGRHSFLTFFGAALLVSDLAGRGLEQLVVRFPAFGIWFFDHVLLTVPVMIAAQLAVTLYLMARLSPPGSTTPTGTRAAPTTWQPAAAGPSPLAYDFEGLADLQAFSLRQALHRDHQLVGTRRQAAQRDGPLARAGTAPSGVAGWRRGRARRVSARPRRP